MDTNQFFTLLGTFVTGGTATAIFQRLIPSADKQLESKNESTRQADTRREKENERIERQNAAAERFREELMKRVDDLTTKHNECEELRHKDREEVAELRGQVRTLEVLLNSLNGVSHYAKKEAIKETKANRRGRPTRSRAESGNQKV